MIIHKFWTEDVRAQILHNERVDSEEQAIDKMLKTMMYVADYCWKSKTLQSRPVAGRPMARGYWLDGQQKRYIVFGTTQKESLRLNY